MKNQNSRSEAKVENDNNNKREISKRQQQSTIPIVYKKMKQSEIKKDQKWTETKKEWNKVNQKVK